MKPASDSPFSPLEWATIAAIVVIWGVNNAAGKLATAALPPLLVGGLRFAFALAFATEPDLVPRAQAAGPFVWSSVAYAGLVSSVCATVMLFWLVQRREAGRFTPYLLTTPLVTSILGVLAFHDLITPRLIVGAAATLGGVAVVALAERRRTALAAVTAVSRP
jgi:drug/metabolite transporter (DMT)-like permease